MEKNFPEITGRKIVAYFNFDTIKEPELVVKVALSAASTEGAIKNLHAEASGKSFEELAEAARADWNNELDHFEAEGTADQKVMLYTSLYHTMINPSVYMDVDGSYRGLGSQYPSGKRLHQLHYIFTLGYLPCGTSVPESCEAGTQCGHGGVND